MALRETDFTEPHDKQIASHKEFGLRKKELRRAECSLKKQY